MKEEEVEEEEVKEEEVEEQEEKVDEEDKKQPHTLTANVTTRRKSVMPYMERS